jgi:hypothetical protein
MTNIKKHNVPVHLGPDHPQHCFKTVAFIHDYFHERGEEPSNHFVVEKYVFFLTLIFSTPNTFCFSVMFSHPLFGF